jgi:hypothetical protein
MAVGYIEMIYHIDISDDTTRRVGAGPIAPPCRRQAFTIAQ